MCECLSNSRHHSKGLAEHSPVAIAPAGQQVYTVVKIKTCRLEMAVSRQRAVANGSLLLFYESTDGFQKELRAADGTRKERVIGKAKEWYSMLDRYSWQLL